VVGAQAWWERLDRVLSRIDLGEHEAAECPIGGARTRLGGDPADAY
jgi:aldehyde dehydrogenase